MIRMCSPAHTPAHFGAPARHCSAHPGQLTPEKWICCGCEAQKVSSGCTDVTGVSGFIRKLHHIENIVLTTIRDTKLIEK